MATTSGKVQVSENQLVPRVTETLHPSVMRGHCHDPGLAVAGRCITRTLQLQGQVRSGHTGRIHVDNLPEQRSPLLTTLAQLL